VGTSGACSNKRSRKDKYSSGLEFSARLRRKGERMRRNSYTMNVDKETNYYSCKGFEYLVRNCRNQRFVR